MKKTAAALLALLFLFANACAFAFNGTGYPGWDGVSAPENSLQGSFGDERLRLEFDGSADYSGLKNGRIKACFFAFDAAEQHYLEMYLQLPRDLAAGDVISSAKPDLLTSVTLYEISETREDLYYAGQIAGFSYPEGSSFEIRIEAAEQSAEALDVRGAISARLCLFDENDRVTGETLQLDDIHFHFSLPLKNAGAPAVPENTATPAPAQTASPLPTLPQAPFATPAPKHTLDPHPAFTLPPDYRVI